MSSRSLFRFSSFGKFFKAYYRAYKNKVMGDTKELLGFVGSVLLLLVSLGFCYLGFSLLTGSTYIPFLGEVSLPEIPSRILDGVLFSLFSSMYFFFVFMPITGFVKKGEDPSFLLKFPVSYLEAFSIESLRSLVSLWKFAVFIVPGVTFLLYLSGNVLVFLVALLGYFMFLLHLSGLGFIVLSFLQGFLQDRRFRDIAGAIVGLSGVMIYLVFFILPRVVPVREVIELGYSSRLLLPSGWLIEVASGDLVWVLPLGVVFLFTFFLGSRFFEYSYYLSSEGGGSSKEVRNFKISIPVGKSVNTILTKNFKYLFRDPVLKKSFLSLAIFPVIFGFQALEGGEFGGSMYLAVMLGSFFSLLFVNYLGYEREGVFKLFSSPVDRKSIILGWNILIGFLAVVYFVGVFVVFNVLFGMGFFEPVLVSLSVFLVTISVGNVIAVKFAQKMPVDSFSSNRSNSFTGMILFGVVSLVLLIPVFIFLFGGYFFVPEIPIFVPVVYGVVVYIGGLGFSGFFLERYEIEILEEFN